MRVFVGVYWEARREDISVCMARLHRHFEILKDASPNLGQWYHGGRRKPTADRFVETQSPEVLAELLSKGVNRKDTSRDIIPDLGFSVSLWNGDTSGWSVGTSVTCGLYLRSGNLSNVANLSIEFSEPESPSLEMMHGVFEQLIEVWEPQTGVLEQNYTPPYEGGGVPEREDIIYASYWTSGTGKKGGGIVKRLGPGWLWTSARSGWV